MQAMWRAESNNSDTDGSGEFGEDQELNLALMAQVEDVSSLIDIDGIIVSKNILDESTIEFLRNITLSKNKELNSKQQVSTSTFSNSKNEVYLNFFCDSDESDDDDCVTVNDSSLSLRNKLIVGINARLESLLDKRNSALLTKEKYIMDLNIKILKLESKTRESEIKIN
jgi:hypothetical protein